MYLTGVHYNVIDEYLTVRNALDKVKR